jgi:triphosphoribosyl-dephospho-CoA synthase
MSEASLSPGGLATLCCILEVVAPKPGNVHRGADFEDVTLVDFTTSAVILGNVIDGLPQNSVGDTILQAVRSNSEIVGTNTNLGIILLLVPLAKLVALDSDALLNPDRISNFLSGLSHEDGGKIYEAIRLASPGGLGTAQELDVGTASTDSVDLMAAMALARERDLVAQQYSDGFRLLFEVAIPLIEYGRELLGGLTEGIVYAHVALMAKFPDSLIVRKCGLEVAEHSQMLASKAIETLSGDGMREFSECQDDYWGLVSELDFWLRSDGHRRNPGTTADLIAASLFIGIHNRIIKPPFR